MAVVATSEIATREVEVAVIDCVALFYEEGKDMFSTVLHTNFLRIPTLQLNPNMHKPNNLLEYSSSVSLK